MRLRKFRWIFFALTSGVPSGWAAGFENPLGPAARQQALAGAVLGGEQGATSMFRNPAGLSGVEAVEAVGGLGIQSMRTTAPRPNVPAAEEGDPEISSGVHFLPVVAAAARLEDWLVVGLGAGPLGHWYAGSSAIGTSAYEVSPVVAWVVPEEWIAGRLTLAVGYRVSLVRQLVRSGNPSEEGTDLWGTDAAGVRVGVQYNLVPELRLGAAWRSSSLVSTHSRQARFDGAVTDLGFSQLIPLQIGGGARVDIDRFGLAVDYEFTATGDADAAQLTGVRNGEGFVLVQRQAWSDSHGIRAGLEYRVPLGRNEVPLRAGYAWQSPATSIAYPNSATPPASGLNTITAGLGWATREFNVNAAFYYRLGRARVDSADLGVGCDLCGGAGDYGADIFGASLDAAVLFEL